MKTYDFIFVVLGYRNTEDLDTFYDSLKSINGTYKVILVESYYDDETTKKFKTISKKNGFDFLSVENKGYSYGNNQGINYAKKHYKFQYLVVSNADIIIKKLDIIGINRNRFDIMGPTIIRKDGRNQNPMYVNRTWMNTKYLGYVSENFKPYKYYPYLVVYRLQNKIFNLFKKDSYVYCIHGSFIVFTEHALRQLKYEPFDDNMFLFCEENLLAFKASRLGLSVLYDDNTIVYHKEDGSMKFSKKASTTANAMKSYKYFYENYIIGNKPHQRPK